MSSIDKVKIGSTSYDVSPSKSGTLSGFTSNDASTPTAWTSSDVILATDTNSSIFAKLTTMIKNVRWLYAKLGDTDFSATGSATVSGAISNLQTSLSGKANTSHTHAVADLPVSSQQINSTAYIPTSSLLYSMQEQITSLNDALTEHIESGGDSGGGDGGSTVPDDYDANTENGYSISTSYTLSSTSDVDTFLTRFQRSNGYKDETTSTTLKLGNKITISDGTYNADWYVAGFDLEHNATASDSTVYDNGYGIALVPVTQLGAVTWNSSNTLTGAYTSSTMHKSHIPTRMSALQTVLGDHLVYRSVLLSTAVSGSGSSMNSSAYAWTKCYGTLMSIGQMTGTFASNRNKYDDGEANYKLPLFDNMEYKTGSHFWSRGVWGYYYDRYYRAWSVSSDGSVGYLVTNTLGVRPLIYIR